MFKIVPDFQEQNDNKDDIPITSFPTKGSTTMEALNTELTAILINSDSTECNNNLSIFMKIIIDNVYRSDGNNEFEKSRNYHSLSLYALKLLTSNLFIKNFKFCVCKMMGFLNAFTELTASCVNNVGTIEDEKIHYESGCYKEFVCITLLLLLKIKNSNQSHPVVQNREQSEELNLIDVNVLFETLKELDIITIIANFITTHIIASETVYSPFLLLKFGCDIFFEYLYHSELLSDNEFDNLTNQTKLIPTLINHLLSNDNFNNYDIDGDDFEDEDKLVAYEEFKLLLLINEQYLMKSYTCGEMNNKVFDGLMRSDDVNEINNNNITGFINLLVYHLNREESQIIKILILKFLYLVFTTSYTAKLIYLNDLKILVDIFIRELNNLDYTEDGDNGNTILLITYLKVMYPLLMFSQLSEMPGGYKHDEILEILRNLIINSPLNNAQSPINEPVEEYQEVITKLAMRCISIPWLKRYSKKNYQSPQQNSLLDKASTSTSSSSSSLSLKPQIEQVQSPQLCSRNTSGDSIGASFTRVASVRTTARSDYHKHTTSHNDNLASSEKIYAYKRKTMLIENNNNIFLSNVFDSLTMNNTNISKEISSQLQKVYDGCHHNDRHQESHTNLLDLPNEYLHAKPLPRLPTANKFAFYEHNVSSSSINLDSSLVRKALKKKAPPPPLCLDQLTNNRSNSSSPYHRHNNLTPPPPPPPRRRR